MPGPVLSIAVCLGSLSQEGYDGWALTQDDMRELGLKMGDRKTGGHGSGVFCKARSRCKPARGGQRRRATSSQEVKPEAGGRSRRGVETSRSSIRSCTQYFFVLYIDPWHSVLMLFLCI